MHDTHQNLLDTFAQFVERPVEDLWGECFGPPGTSSKPREDLRTWLVEAHIHGIVVLRYLPSSNRLLPVRPLIISSKRGSCPTSTTDGENESNYFKTWAGDESAMIGRSGLGFLASFVDLYYRNLYDQLSANRSSLDTTAEVADAFGEFLIPRGYSSLLLQFSPSDWYSRRRRKRNKVAAIDYPLRHVTSLICRYVRDILREARQPCYLERRAQADSVACDAVQDIITSEVSRECARHADRLRELFWWVPRKEWRSYERGYAEIQRIFGAIGAATGSSGLDVVRDTLGTLNTEQARELCSLVKQLSPVWPCTAGCMHWEDRIGVPIISRGEFIGLIAMGLPIGEFAKPGSQVEQNLFDLARLAEGTVLASDRVVGDPALPLVDIHRKVSEEANLAKTALRQVKNLPPFAANLSSEKITAAALCGIFPSTWCPGNAKIYEKAGLRIQESSALRDMAKNDPQALETYREYLNDLSRPRALRENLASKYMPVDWGVKSKDATFDAWLSSLGFSDVGQQRRSSWLIGHLWHTDQSLSATKLVFVTGQLWHDEYWSKTAAVYTQMRESLRNLFFERGTTGSSYANFQPFALWMLDDLSSRRDATIAPLLFPVAALDATGRSSPDEFIYKHCLSYGENTLVLMRQQLPLFPWAPEITDRWDRLKNDCRNSTCREVVARLRCITQASIDQPINMDDVGDLAAIILNADFCDIPSSSNDLGWRSSFWRELSNCLVERATREHADVLRAVALQLFVGVGVPRGDDSFADFLGRSYDSIVKDMLEKTPRPQIASGSIDVGLAGWREELLSYGDLSNADKALHFVAHLILNIMMWDWRCLYFFPATTGIKKPHAGMFFSVERPLTDTEFEAIQRSTEEVFLPAYEFETELVAESAAREKERRALGWSLLHLLKNLLLSASAPQQIVNEEFGSLLADIERLASKPQSADSAHALLNAILRRARTLSADLATASVLGQSASARVNSLWQSQGITTDRESRWLGEIAEATVRLSLSMAKASLERYGQPIYTRLAGEYGTRSLNDAKKTTQTLLGRLRSDVDVDGADGPITATYDQMLRTMKVRLPDRVEQVLVELVWNAVKRYGDYVYECSLEWSTPNKPLTLSYNIGVGVTRSDGDVYISVTNPCTDRQYERFIASYERETINGLNLIREIAGHAGWNVTRPRLDNGGVTVALVLPESEVTI